MQTKTVDSFAPSISPNAINEKIGRIMQPKSEENLNLVRRIYQSADIAEIAAAFAPDIEIYQTEELPWGGRYSGFAGAQQFFARLRGNIHSVVTIEEIFPVENKIVVKGRTRGTVLKNNQNFDVSVVHIWTLDENGKLAKFEPFIDVTAMLKALQ